MGKASSTWWLPWSKRWQGTLPRAGWGSRLARWSRRWGSRTCSCGAGTSASSPPQGPTCWLSSLPSSRQGASCQEEWVSKMTFIKHWSFPYLTMSQPMCAKKKPLLALWGSPWVSLHLWWSLENGFVIFFSCVIVRALWVLLYLVDP